MKQKCFFVVAVAFNCDEKPESDQKKNGGIHFGSAGCCLGRTYLCDI